jgi:hypothetical protein
MTYRTRLIAAAAVAAAAVPFVLAAGGQAQQPTGRTLSLKISGTNVSAVDVPPLMRSRKATGLPGDMVIAISQVSGAATGRRYLHCTVVAKGPSIEKGTFSCMGSYVLADGTIEVAGVVRLDRDATVAVTGGTGAYVGARGTLSSSTAGTDVLALQ